MYLIVDLGERGTIKLQLVSSGASRTRVYVGRNTDLLVALDKFFKLCRIAPKDLLGVAVHGGEGSFTSARVAITWANAFSHVTRRPIISLTSEELVDFNYLKRKFSETSSVYVSANYVSGPNISENRSLWNTIRQKVAK